MSAGLVCRAAATALTALVVAVPATLTPGAAVAAPTYDGPVEGYASYQPQKKCRDTARPGTRELARWINRRYDGGPARATVRACTSGGVSEHKDGRAIDWTMDATKKKQRREVRRLLTRIFATDKRDNEHARARRMGVMYLIWNDHMYASYDDHFAKEDYLSSSCSSRRKCSKTLRHRDHVHISLSRAGGRGDTSWYDARD